MNGAVEILLREREAASEQMRALRARVRDLDSAIALIQGQPAPVRAAKGEGGVNTKVLQVVVEAGEAGITPNEIATSLTNAGRQTSVASVSSALSRLKGDAKVTNQSGRWFAENETAVETDDVSVVTSAANGWDELDDDTPF